jgi:hypothetical protein
MNYINVLKSVSLMGARPSVFSSFGSYVDFSKSQLPHIHHVFQFLRKQITEATSITQVGGVSAWNNHELWNAYRNKLIINTRTESMNECLSKYKHIPEVVQYVNKLDISQTQNQLSNGMYDCSKELAFRVKTVPKCLVYNLDKQEFEQVILTNSIEYTGFLTMYHLFPQSSDLYSNLTPNELFMLHNYHDVYFSRTLTFKFNSFINALSKKYQHETMPKTYTITKTESQSLLTNKNIYCQYTAVYSAIDFNSKQTLLQLVNRHHMNEFDDNNSKEIILNCISRGLLIEVSKYANFINKY